ncbi:DUF6421 family protein [Agilicoccus flavus]|uniref:DUF6421 family protein n=1 Tax=Agilicoccus flavus TaxID=2775968 RepID=UPI0027DA5125|nr:DUF6421 family protein [Agilicoccus flavus]
MGVFPRVVMDESHSEAWSLDPAVAARINPAQPADASYALAAEALRHRGFEVVAHTQGPIDQAVAPGDVLVIAHPAQLGSERSSGAGSPVFAAGEIDALEAFVHAGGGLVVLAECDQDKYGTNLDELLRRFGVHVRSLTCHDGTSRHNRVSAWVLADLGAGAGQGVLAGVGQVCFYRAGALEVGGEQAGGGAAAQVLARTGAQAFPPGAPLAAAVRVGRGRVVVFADSDLFGDDSIAELDHRTLWTNAVTWAAGSAAAAPEPRAPGRAWASDPRWLDLKAAVEALRPLQVKDGSIPDAGQHGVAAALVGRVVAGIAALAPEFPHDAEYLDAVRADLARWADTGFGVPDFLDSLLAFRPERSRADGVVHLVVFPMYTQNGNPNRNVEAVLCSVFWPDWLAQIERDFDNPAFLSFDFVDFTSGYDTNSAVLFPETVAVREVPRFTWGAIFSDREAARFRAVTGAAADLLKLDLPPDAERLVVSQELAQSVFAMWDLVHDRTHSHGDLPFDPFMIKQRMPFWMYALEELRCDLNTFRQAVVLEGRGQPFARGVQYAIVFDRIFRFAITGERVRNYDGLGGQLLFAYLHRHDALRWTDNRLTFDWRRVPETVVALCDEVEALYRDGIDRSKVAHWIASYAFVSAHVAPHPRSTWAKGPDALPLDGPPRGLVDLVLPDEFPLNVFFEALRGKLAPVVASTRGITGRGHHEVTAGDGDSGEGSAGRAPSSSPSQPPARETQGVPA